MSTTTHHRPHRFRNVSFRWMRQIHLWVGAWGALATVVYGFTGLVLNHRFGDNAWPQGDSDEIAKTALVVPATARTSAEALSLWLRDTQGLDAQVIRKGSPGGGNRGGEQRARNGERANGAEAGKRGGNDRAGGQPPKWNLSGGTARSSWSLEYTPGGETAELKQNRQTPLAGLNRLHKGVGGGWAWIVLADSFAIGMLLLGLSGLWMWARGRGVKQVFVSVLFVGLVVWLAVFVPAML
ncbi:PepSY-associated TM helix domain-containing protein [Pseudoxanthomonas helianthi]|uniref:PepSY-associated TM helix domain-containing protein n=1 Tax=Pseudoxanthomonas helianthi TaxID=1453541 RepID=A0A941ARM1_9GAMM|nr:PepSY-associated TM helix domain-containing protein [Pseudoxanthomonas helianthi]MBP3982995.1 PepSY-associated TM helix domain-containing protein [Pseudoxanthomonas helianthi]